MPQNQPQVDEESKKTDVLFDLFEKQCPDDDIKDYDTYFKLYDAEVDALRLGKLKVESPSEKVRRAVNEMRSNPNKTKDQIQTTLLEAGEGSEEQVNEIISCAVRVWLMIDCRPEDGEQSIATHHWKDTEYLFDFVDRVFRIPPKDKNKPEYEKTDQDDMRKEALEATSQLTYRLTGMNLERYSNIETRFTNYLDQHLFFGQTYFHPFRHRRWLLDTLAIWDMSTTTQESLRNPSTDFEEENTPENIGPPKDIPALSNTTAGNSASAKKPDSEGERSAKNISPPKDLPAKSNNTVGNSASASKSTSEGERVSKSGGVSSDNIASTGGDYNRRFGSFPKT